MDVNDSPTFGVLQAGMTWVINLGLDKKFNSAEER